MTVFRPIASLLDLDTLVRSSHDTPVIVFKHSETCGTSWMARESLAEGQLTPTVHEIGVQRQRGLSDALASRFGVRHESPQVLVIAAGTAVWHTSHVGVTAERVAHAFASASKTIPTTPVAGP